LFPYEVTAVMYQGDVENLNYIHNQAFTKKQLTSLSEEEEY